MTFQQQPAEHVQRIRLQRLLQQWKHGLFLAPEMFARGGQSPFKQLPRFGGVSRLLKAFELVVNFVMILVQSIQRSLVSQGLIQSRIGEICLRLAVTA